MIHNLCLSESCLSQIIAFVVYLPFFLLCLYFISLAFSSLRMDYFPMGIIWAVLSIRHKRDRCIDFPDYSCPFLYDWKRLEFISYVIHYLPDDRCLTFLLLYKRRVSKRFGRDWLLWWLDRQCNHAFISLVAHHINTIQSFSRCKYSIFKAWLRNLRLFKYLTWQWAFWFDARFTALTFNSQYFHAVFSQQHSLFFGRLISGRADDQKTVY